MLDQVCKIKCNNMITTGTLQEVHKFLCKKYNKKEKDIRLTSINPASIHSYKKIETIYLKITFTNILLWDINNIEKVCDIEIETENTKVIIFNLFEDNNHKYCIFYKS